jgi:hypothetical protein
MYDNRNIINPLKELKKQIVEQRESLKTDLEAVERLLKKHSSSEENQLPIFAKESFNKKIKPTEAIMQLFNNDPNKAWTPSKLRDELLKLKSKGLLITESSDLQSTVHSILRLKVNNGTLIKDSTKRIPTYRIKKSDSVG